MRYGDDIERPKPLAAMVDQLGSDPVSPGLYITLVGRSG
jgi:hypothetical protein